MGVLLHLKLWTVLIIVFCVVSMARSASTYLSRQIEPFLQALLNLALKKAPETPENKF